MEALIFMFIVGLAVFVFFTLKRQQTEVLSPVEETDPVAKFVHFKKRILATSAYDQSSTYELLYGKVSQLTRELLSKHNAVLVNSAAKSKIENSFSSYFEKENEHWRIRRALDIRSVESGELLAIAMMSFSSGEWHQQKSISQNRFFTNRAIEHLIQRQYWQATLAKALIHKYGFQEFLPPETRTADALLSEVLGVYPDAYAEKRNLSLLYPLEQMKGGGGIHASMLWRPHAELEELIHSYHPTNING